MANIDDPRERTTSARGITYVAMTAQGRIYLVFSGRTLPLDEPSEGVTWIRGHHTEESDEGKALLAAFALAHT